MGLRAAHGKAASYGAVSALETKPIDELPSGVPAHADDVSRVAAAEAGPFAEGNRRSVLGGRARKGKPRMVERVALQPPAEGMPTRRYHVAAKGLVRAVVSSLAKTIGGGQLDAHTAYLATAGGRAAKWANYYSDLAETLPAGSKEQRETVALALSADEKASSHLRNCHEYAARMAEARRAAAPPGDAHRALALALSDES